MPGEGGGARSATAMTRIDSGPAACPARQSAPRCRRAKHRLRRRHPTGRRHAAVADEIRPPQPHVAGAAFAPRIAKSNARHRDI
ncbi:hypothetical protein C7S13_7094 [Burkholderia cepacia]|nr:hypothetical protein [Burkholderia cepacia]